MLGDSIYKETTWERSYAKEQNTGDEIGWTAERVRERMLRSQEWCRRRLDRRNFLAGLGYDTRRQNGPWRRTVDAELLRFYPSSKVVLQSLLSILILGSKTLREKLGNWRHVIRA